MAEQYSIVYIYIHRIFFCWWTPRLIRSLAIVNSASVNMGVQVPLLYADLTLRHINA
jgi:hypothetical protein